MSNNVNLMTREGIAKLKNELKQLLEVKRPQIIKQIQEAREQGDLSENADYDAAKNQQAILENRIKEIEEILNHTEIIDSQKSKAGSGEKVVKIGSVVTVFDFSDNSKQKYTIVGTVEANPVENKISNESPLAKSIIGKKVKDEANVRGIEEPYKIRIESIE